MAKGKFPIKKGHVITGVIALVVVIGFLWVTNNVAPAKDAAEKLNIKG